MQKYLIPHAQTGYFSKIMLDYLQNNEHLQPFYTYQPNIESFAAIIENVQQQSFDRPTLVKVLRNQYAHLPCTEKVDENIGKLYDDKTFVVVTGHQTNLFTGHLYFFYKIISTINLCEQLSQHYPDYQFVPIYWMGSEDHDFAEINHVHVFGETLTWEQEQKGATGRIKTNTLTSVLADLEKILGNYPRKKALLELLKTAYLGQETLAKATQALVNELFGDYGLVVLDQDSLSLKKLFKEVVKQEMLEQISFSTVTKTNELLEKKGYSPQAHTRVLNMFYLTDDFRKRLIFRADKNQFEVVNTKLTFTPVEVTKEIEEHPERFSPNVILRPVYQQFLLPCLAYIGGGGELAYWLQLKSTFERFKVHYPMLILRNSVLWVDKNMAKKIKKIGLTISDLFKSTDKLLADYVKKHSEHQLNLSTQKKELALIFQTILEKAIKVDTTLEASVKGEMTKMKKMLTNLEGKLLRAEKRNFEVSNDQIRAIKTRLFPNNTLQERYDNFIPFYLKYGDEFIVSLKENLNPLQPQFLVLMEE